MDLGTYICGSAIKRKIKVRIMCFEYLEPEEYEIDIEVV